MLTPGKTNSANPRGLTTKEAMATLKVSHATLYRLLAAGKISGRKIGRSTIIDADSVDRFWDTLPPAKFRAPREVV